MTNLPEPFYEADGITIYCGDNREILPLLAGPCDLLLTDPPYGIGEARDKVSRGKLKGFNGKRQTLAFTRDYGSDDWDDEPADPETLKWAIHICRFATIFGGNFFALPASSCWLVWDKDNAGTDFADCELAWTNFKTAVRKFKWRWNGMLQEDMANKEIRFHPTQKPEALMRWCIAHADKAGKRRAESILDPWGGAGTTAVAAKLMGRRCVMIERERKYCEAAAERLAQGVLLPV